LEDETVWLTQAHLCELFQKSKATISEHIKNIFKEGELLEELVVRNFRTTAAELVYHRSNAALPLMGMQSFDKQSYVEVKKGDVCVAKNYLSESEMMLLGLLVEQYLAFAETMAQQNTPMYMKDWVERLDSILQLNGRDLLNHAGKISHQKAVEKSAVEYDKYKEQLRQLQHEQSLQELVHDLKTLKPKNTE
jgi:hypothetical protein